MRRHLYTWQNERGSSSVEAATIVPAFVLFIGLLVFAGRTYTARQGIEVVAADAARAASLARTPEQARAAANDTLTYSLANNGLKCAEVHVDIDTSGLVSKAGTFGTVTATVTCTIALHDLAVPGVPGSHTVSASMVSPVDPWRQRALGAPDITATRAEAIR